MSNALKSAAESTVHTLSDFVEGARDRLEGVIENVKDELPPLTRSKHDRHIGRWALIAAAVVLMVAMIARRRSSNGASDMASPDSAGARLTEPTLAVS